MSTQPETVVVGLSGGVDSSVAALLLKRQGYRVIGIFMKNWEDDDTEEYCSSRQDFVDAVSVAEVLGIEIEAVNFAAEYRERVFRHFLEEYRAGRTPNPDVLCNSEIKFKSFLDHALRLGADWIATGHYARLTGEPGRRQLCKAVDRNKDQSYFLHRLNQQQLARVMFPLGGMTKPEVRAIAAREGLPTFAKKDSTGICFIGERPFREFLARYLPRQPGDLVTAEGVRLGQHQGLVYYTLGQRQGLGIGGQAAGEGLPWYVAAKKLHTNTLVVVQGHDHPLLQRAEILVDDWSWISGSPPAPSSADLAAKTRYRQHDAPCQLFFDSGGATKVSFAQAQWAPTPGQYLVVYQGDVCLGGGVMQ